MQMAQGAEYIAGSFTVPLSGTPYEVQYGKSFGSYLLMIEMFEESKTALQNTGSSNLTAIRYCGMYPAATIGNIVNTYAASVYIYRPDTGATGTSSLGAAALLSSSFKVDTRDVTSLGSVRLIRGYTYHYIVVSLDNVQ